MAARMNQITNVTTEDGKVHVGHSCVVRNNVARLSNGARDVVVRPDVATVKPIDARRAVISFENGDVWTTERPAPKGGCGCGR